MATTTKKTQAAKSRTVALKKEQESAPEAEPELDVPPGEFVDGVLTIDEAPAEARPQGIPLRLVGKDYTIRPPKMAMSLRLGKASRAAQKSQDVEKILDVLNQWVNAAMGPKQATEVMARLEDFEDALDYDHIMRLIEAVVEHGSEGTPSNPPT